MVKIPLLGRRGTLAILTILTGIHPRLSNSPYLRRPSGWNCAYSFTSNVMYGLIYAVTLEHFPTKDRGTGDAICSSADRIFGIMPLIIALYADITPSVLVFISVSSLPDSLIYFCCLKFESHGHASL